MPPALISFCFFWGAPRLENTWKKLDQETLIVIALQKTFSVNNLLVIIVSGLPDATKNYINKVLLNIGEIYKTVSHEHFCLTSLITLHQPGKIR